jgi:hypothetical protein
VSGILPIARWRQRVLIYKFFAALPFGHRLFDWVRAHLGLNREFDVGKRAYSMEEMQHMLAQVGFSVKGKHLVEIGSGWHPVLPAFFHAMGASRIVMTDIEAHITARYVHQVLDYLTEHADELSQLSSIPASNLRQRWMALRPQGEQWRDIWAEKGIEYHAPLDFTQDNWAADSVDMVYSNSCISYIPEPILRQIFQQAQRILKPAGLMAHNLMPYDDYATTDADITPLNFLRYDEKTWARIGNCALHFQNRLRPQDYLNLLIDTGFTPRFSERRQHHIKTKMLDRSVLADMYQDCADEELLCAHFLVVAEKTAT